jgi:tetratricopeptide (TPR) repeat protein
MKNIIVLFFALLMAGTMMAQDPVKDMKKAARLLGTYNMDMSAGEDELEEAISLANASIKDPTVSSDASAWLTYGEIFMAAVNRDVIANVADNASTIEEPTAPAKAYTGFKMAAELADKSYHAKDAMKALAAGLQNIYYLGSALYQAGNYKAAYEAFKATYDAYSLLQKNNEPNTFSADEHPKSLYYSGLCAQQAGMMTEAQNVYKQLVDAGSDEPGVYEALFNMYVKDNPAEAEKILAIAREKFPEDTGILYAEINYYLQKGELAGLISKLEKAIQIEPDNVSVYVTLGQIYDKLYQDAITTDPVKAEEHFNNAMSYYQQSLAKDPKNFDATYSIGALWYNKAAAYSVELNNLSSDYSAEGNRKYEAKKAQMDEAFDKALPIFLQAEQLMPTDYNTLIALREIYARQDKLDIAEQYKVKIEQAGKQ